MSNGTTLHPTPGSNIEPSREPDLREWHAEGRWVAADGEPLTAASDERAAADLVADHNALAATVTRLQAERNDAVAALDARLSELEQENRRAQEARVTLARRIRRERPAHQDTPAVPSDTPKDTATWLPWTSITIDEARAKLSGLHFAKEALSDGEREILYIAEGLLRVLDDRDPNGNAR